MEESQCTADGTAEQRESSAVGRLEARKRQFPQHAQMHSGALASPRFDVFPPYCHALPAPSVRFGAWRVRVTASRRQCHLQAGAADEEGARRGRPDRSSRSGADHGLLFPGRPLLVLLPASREGPGHSLPLTRLLHFTLHCLVPSAAPAPSAPFSLGPYRMVTQVPLPSPTPPVYLNEQQGLFFQQCPMTERP